VDLFALIFIPAFKKAMVKTLSLSILYNVLKDLRDTDADKSEYMSVLNDYTDAFIHGEFTKSEYIIGVKMILQNIPSNEGERGDKGGREGEIKSNSIL
jgi:hypothetical protein